MSLSSSDAGVIATAEDALLCKLFATRKRYWKDPFLVHFASMRRPSRRPPLINRGYFARVMALEKLVRQFAQAAGAAAQVISVGAGLDTTFFRLRDAGDVFAEGTLYFEVDFAEVGTVYMDSCELRN